MCGGYRTSFESQFFMCRHYNTTSESQFSLPRLSPRSRIQVLRSVWQLLVLLLKHLAGLSDFHDSKKLFFWNLPTLINIFSNSKYRQYHFYKIQISLPFLQFEKFYLYFPGTTEVILRILIDLSVKLTNVKRKAFYLNCTSRAVSDLSFLKTCTEVYIFKYEIHFLKDTQKFSETRKTDFVLVIVWLITNTIAHTYKYQ